MTNTALAIYTGKSVNKIVKTGGSQSWVLDPQKARQNDFAVLCFNPNADWSEGTVSHGAAFLVGRISNVVESTDTAGRWLVLFDEYAEIDLPNTWGGWRNPIKYTTLEELGIDVSTLTFKTMPERNLESLNVTPVVAEPLTIEAAKAGLAANFGVEPEAVEITIKG